VTGTTEAACSQAQYQKGGHWESPTAASGDVHHQASIKWQPCTLPNRFQEVTSSAASRLAFLAGSGRFAGSFNLRSFLEQLAEQASDTRQYSHKLERYVLKLQRQIQELEVSIFVGTPGTISALPPPQGNMSPKKKQKQGWQQALTEAEVAERSCSICDVSVPGAYTWLDPDTQQPCYGSLGEAERAVGQPKSEPPMSLQVQLSCHTARSLPAPRPRSRAPLPASTASHVRTLRPHPPG
jgi:hypothetical protein